jgi:hypothetical protein
VDGSEETVQTQVIRMSPLIRAAMLTVKRRRAFARALSRLEHGGVKIPRHAPHEAGGFRASATREEIPVRFAPPQD